MRHFFFYLFLSITCTSSFAQDLNYQSLLLDAALTRHANAVVRDEVVEINVESIRITDKPTEAIVLLKIR